MRLTTLCYIERDDSYLMMHRVKKAQDENAGKWIGVGGHLNEDESPDACVIREVKEETGLRMKDFRLRGIITFILPEWGNELTFLYTGHAEGQVQDDCNEGILRWIPKKEILQLPLWEGDRAFLPLLQTRNDCFFMKLIYAEGGKLKRCILDGEDITDTVCQIAKEKTYTA